MLRDGVSRKYSVGDSHPTMQCNYSVHADNTAADFKSTGIRRGSKCIETTVFAPATSTAHDTSIILSALKTTKMPAFNTKHSIQCSHNTRGYNVGFNA